MADVGEHRGGLLVAAIAGLDSLELSLVGRLVGGGHLLPFALLSGIGWADVLGAVGAWEGWSFALRTMLWTALLGAVLAIVAWRRAQRAFPYVPPIALGALVAMLVG